MNEEEQTLPEIDRIEDVSVEWNTGIVKSVMRRDGETFEYEWQLSQNRNLRRSQQIARARLGVRNAEGWREHLAAAMKLDIEVLKNTVEAMENEIPLMEAVLRRVENATGEDHLNIL